MSVSRSVSRSRSNFDCAGMTSSLSPVLLLRLVSGDDDDRRHRKEAVARVSLPEQRHEAIPLLPGQAPGSDQDIDHARRREARRAERVDAGPLKRPRVDAGNFESRLSHQADKLPAGVAIGKAFG